MTKLTFFEAKINQKKASPPWLFLIINAISFITFSIIAFYHNLPYLFYSEDGRYMLTLAREDFFWRGLEFGFTNNFLQSIGGPRFPMHTMFIPGYAIMNLIHDTIAYGEVAAYVVFSCELFITGLIVSRLVNQSWNLAVTSAWVLPLLAYPYYSYPALYNIMSLVPQLGTMIMVTNLIIVLFVGIGPNGIFRSALFSICIGTLIFYIVIAYPLSIMLCAPIATIICIVYLIACGSRNEKKIKLLFSLGIFLAVCVLIPYCYGLFKFSVPNYLPSELYIGADRPSWISISILFYGKVGIWLYMFACLGVIFHSIFGDALRKVIARAVLIAMIVLMGFGVSIVFINYWHGPAPLYCEFILWPFYIAYSVGFIFLILSFTRKLFFSNFQMGLNFYIKSLVVLLPWTMFIFPKSHGDGWNISKVPVKSPIVEVLNRDISLTPGKEFRGRVANFTGSKLKQGITWPDLAANDGLILRKTGNDHRMNGLWYYNIPTFDVYGPLISPTYFYFSKSIFSLSDDKQMRSIMLLRHIDIRWLKALGVRFVITDIPLKKATLRKMILLGDIGSLYLYELSSPNIGQYSPTRVISLVNVKSVLKILMKNDFDPKNQIVVDAQLPGNLNTAEKGKLIVEKGFLRVLASSKGNSIILLPLEFSHCLSMISHISNEKEPKLFRANLVQTGILFHGTLDVSVRYFTGPFYHSTCRIDDAKDFEKSTVYVDKN